MFEEVKITDIIGAVSSVLASLAIVISYLNYLHHKKELYAKNIASLRMDWIENVRRLVAEYIRLYDQGKTEDLLSKKSEIELFLDYNKHNPSYEALGKALDMCLLNPDPDQELKRVVIGKIVLQAQKVLALVYARMKEEYGLTAKGDSKIRKSVRENYPS